MIISSMDERYYTSHYHSCGRVEALGKGSYVEIEQELEQTRMESDSATVSVSTGFTRGSVATGSITIGSTAIGAGSAHGVAVVAANDIVALAVAANEVFAVVTLDGTFAHPVTRYGYCRGTETVAYVKRITDFYEHARREISA